MCFLLFSAFELFVKSWCLGRRSDSRRPGELLRQGGAFLWQRSRCPTPRHGVRIALCCVLRSIYDDQQCNKLDNSIYFTTICFVHRLRFLPFGPDAGLAMALGHRVVGAQVMLDASGQRLWRNDAPWGFAITLWPVMWPTMLRRLGMPVWDVQASTGARKIPNIKILKRDGVCCFFFGYL